MLRMLSVTVSECCPNGARMYCMLPRDWGLLLVQNFWKMSWWLKAHSFENQSANDIGDNDALKCCSLIPEPCTSSRTIVHRNKLLMHPLMPPGEDLDALQSRSGHTLWKLSDENNNEVNGSLFVATR